jgi:hypothetical protein
MGRRKPGRLEEPDRYIIRTQLLATETCMLVSGLQALMVPYDYQSPNSVHMKLKSCFGFGCI